MKKWAVVLIALVMLTAAMAAQAEERELQFFISGDYEYTVLEDGTAVIVGYGGEESDLNIPSELDGHLVTRIEDCVFWFCDDLRTVKIPDSVTSLGDMAFWYCESLSSAEIPASEPI